MRKIKLGAVFIFPVIALLTGIGFYIFKFHSGNFSDNPQDWGSFGTYVTMLSNLSNLSVVIFFSYLVFQYNKRNNKESSIRDAEFKKFQRDLAKPLLVFKTVTIDSEEKWQILNIGNGAALNLLVGYKSKWDEEWIGPIVKCYSLGKGDSIIIDWFEKGPDVIGVHYMDIFEFEFISFVANDTSVVREYYENFKSIEINAHTYPKSYFDEMISNPSIRHSKVNKKKTV